MARKKTSKAVAVRGSTAMSTHVVGNPRMAALAEEEADRGVPGGSSNYLSAKGGSFTFQGADLGDEMDIVVIDYVYLNEWHDKPYDPDNPSNPACYSLSVKGPKGEDMVPAENAPDPQAEFCKDCELNQWGTAKVGRGKACGNKKRLAMIDAAALSDPGSAEVVFLRAGVNSSVNFEKYKEGLRKVHNTPPVGVVTHISFDQEADNPINLFEVKLDEDGTAVRTDHDDEVVDALFALRDRVRPDLMEQYDYSGQSSSDDAPRAKAGKGKAAGKAAPSKKTSGKKSRFS